MNKIYSILSLLTIAACVTNITKTDNPVNDAGISGFAGNDDSGISSFAGNDDTGSAGMYNQCIVGDINCKCYPNNTCNFNLRCVNNACIAEFNSADAGAGGESGENSGLNIQSSGSGGGLNISGGGGTIDSGGTVSVAGSLNIGGQGGGVAVECSNGFTTCNGSYGTCDANINNDSSNCGYCGHLCTANSHCSNAQCVEQACSAQTCDTGAVCAIGFQKSSGICISNTTDGWVNWITSNGCTPLTPVTPSTISACNSYYTNLGFSLPKNNGTNVNLEETGGMKCDYSISSSFKTCGLFGNNNGMNCDKDSNTCVCGGNICAHNTMCGFDHTCTCGGQYCLANQDCSVNHTCVGISGASCSTTDASKICDDGFVCINAICQKM